MMWIMALMWACNGQKEQETGAGISQCLAEDSWKSPTELFPNLPTTQIHSDIAFDGARLWMVFNLPNADNQFDVYLAGWNCDGSIYQEASQILAIEGLNQTTPRIAVSQDRILVAAQADDGSGSNNMSIWLYVQDSMGTVLSQNQWNPVIDGVETGSDWLPSIVGTENGFWMASTSANSEYFRIAVQRLDGFGNVVGNPFWVGPDEWVVYPNIDGTDEDFVVGWEDGNDAVGWQTGKNNGELGAIQIQPNAGSIKVLWNEGDVQSFYHQRDPLQVQVNAVPITSQSNTILPNVALGVDHSLAIFFGIQSGYQNDVWVSLLDNEQVLQPDILLQSDPPAAPYRPAITHLGEDRFFVMWSQGNNPEFRLWGQVVALE